MTETGRVQVGERTIVALEGDLTAQDCDVVVNAANSRLSHGGGVAAALVRAAGPWLQSESDAWVREHGPVGDGQAAVTTAGNMPARWIVHVVGPVHDSDRTDNAALLEQAVRAALDAAKDLQAGSVAVPAISSGIYGYPLEEATGVIAGAARAWLAADPGAVHEIRLVGFDRRAAEAFAAALGG